VAGFDYEMLCDKAAGLALAQAREAIYWRGLSGKLTYGLLNSPNMPAITAVASTGTGSSPLWVNKTYLLILDDIRTKLMAAITDSTLTGFDVYTDACTLLLAPDAFNYISTFNVQGNISVKDQLLQTYKGMTIEAAPYLKDAHNSTDDVMMLIASQAVDYDESTDDLAVVSPIVCVSCESVNAPCSLSNNATPALSPCLSAILSKSPCWTGKELSCTAVKSEMAL